MRTLRTSRARRQRVGTKKARSKRGTRARKTRGSRSRKSSDKQLSETLSLPKTLSSVLQAPKKSVKGKRPVIEMETSSEPVKKTKSKTKKKKKSKKTKSWHAKIHGKKGKKKKKHKKKKMKGGVGTKYGPSRDEINADIGTRIDNDEADQERLRLPLGKDKTTDQMNPKELDAIKVLGYTPKTWDRVEGGGHNYDKAPNVYDKSWTELTKKEKEALKTLGVTSEDGDWPENEFLK